jgi:hypothetical protein
MNMQNYEGFQAREKSIADAIHAVELQMRHRMMKDTQTTARLRKNFYALLDRQSSALFDGIAKAAATSKREFCPSSIPAFRNECDKIFGLGSIYDPDLFNDWLHSRDLRHLFWSSEASIRW